MEPHRLALPSGYRIENYEIQGVLGKGGFGITYVAYDSTLGRHMAIKELLPDSIATRIEGSTVVAMGPSHEESWQWARDRFIEEARILAGFRHPNIIAVHRLIEANGTVYLVMDHLEGESYETRLRRIGREPDQASLMRVIGPLLDGLQEVHAANLLHRDIKPENILFDKRDNPILIDFGAARATVEATMTMTSIVTHGYSPIEQYQTKGKMGPWTDIYAMGAVMCRAITGEKPPTSAERVEEDEYMPLGSRFDLPSFSGAFLKAVDKALQVWAKDRPQKIEDCKFLAGKVSQVLPEFTAKTAGKKSMAAVEKRGRVRLPVPLFVAIAVCSMLVFFVVRSSYDRAITRIQKQHLTENSGANDRLNESNQKAKELQVALEAAKAALNAGQEKFIDEKAALQRQLETAKLQYTNYQEQIQKERQEAEDLKNQKSDSVIPDLATEAKNIDSLNAQATRAAGRKSLKVITTSSNDAPKLGDDFQIFIKIDGLRSVYESVRMIEPFVMIDGKKYSAVFQGIKYESPNYSNTAIVTVMPERAGKLEIPSLTIEAEGIRLKSTPMALHVTN